MKTRMADMLGIEHPILQGAMASLSQAEFIAAVSNGGGLGILAGSVFKPERLAEEVRKVKSLTSKPFAVNLTLFCQTLEESLDVCIKEKVRAMVYSGPNVRQVSQKLKPHGVLTMFIVATDAQARKVEGEGGDIIIASGFEGGGHVGRISTMALLPIVTASVKIPVVAAGGIGDGRGLAAALVMGAEGVQMGTRFICTRESPAHEKVKQFLLAASEDATVVTGHVTGLQARVMKNKLTQMFEDLGEKKAPPQEFEKLGTGKGPLAFVQGDIEMGSIYCGQIVGLVRDIPTVKELIERTVKEAEEALDKANAMFKKTTNKR